MKYLLRFRTRGFDAGQLPRIPRPAQPPFRFAGGVVAGAVVAVTAVTVFQAGPSSSRNALVLVDASASMKGLEDKLDTRLQQLRSQGVSPTVVPTVGFGIHAAGVPGGLLQTLRTAVQLNPSIRKVYLFSDFSCTSPGYDRDDREGLDELARITANRQFWLVSLRDPPSQEIVTLARSAGGGWLGDNGQPVSAAGGRMDTGTLEGAVRGPGGKVVSHAAISIGPAPGDTSAVEPITLLSDASGRFHAFGIPEGRHTLSVKGDEDLMSSLTEFQMKPCERLTEDISLPPPPPPQTKGLFTLAISPAPKRPYYFVHITLTHPRSGVNVAIQISGTDHYTCCTNPKDPNGEQVTDASGKAVVGPIPDGARGVRDTVTATAPGLRETETFTFVF